MISSVLLLLTLLGTLFSASVFAHTATVENIIKTAKKKADFIATCREKKQLFNEISPIRSLLVVKGCVYHQAPPVPAGRVGGRSPQAPMRQRCQGDVERSIEL